MRRLLGEVAHRQHHRTCEEIEEGVGRKKTKKGEGWQALAWKCGKVQKA